MGPEDFHFKQASQATLIEELQVPHLDENEGYSALKYMIPKWKSGNNLRVLKILT